MEEKRFLKRKQRAREDGNLEQWAHYCRELGEYYKNSGKYKDALFQYKEEERVNESLGNPIAVAVSNRMIGEIYCDLGEFEEALKHQKKHLDIAKMENVEIEVQRALANIGRTYFCKAEGLTSSQQPEYNSSLSCAKNAYIKSLKVCENLKGIGFLAQMEMKARLLMNIGLVLECQGDMTKAVDYIEQAIQIGKKHELWEELCQCYSAIGMLFQRSGNHSRALKSLNLALEVAERLGSRVKTSCEILLCKAEVLFLIADFGGAKHALLKAYKLRTPNERDRMTIEKNLRIATAICQTEKLVILASTSDYERLKSMYETLGDGSASVQNFKKAIEFYLKMLECAEKAGEKGQSLCPIYVSLSQTYKDDGQYELAVEYAKKELGLWLEVPHEACKSCLNIAEMLELNKSPYIEVAGTYMKAKEFAVMAEDWKLAVSALRGLQSYQKNAGLQHLSDEAEKEIKEICQQHNVNLSSEDEVGTDEDSQEIGAHINLEELTESSSDEDTTSKLKDGNCGRGRRRATCKGLIVRRNDKGETALHCACIAGNLALARSLLERGHPLNTRDNCGWTPLHEACNHGYDEIVSLLIEKGAQVNDRGGTHCGGVTPIHDAASCGNLSIIKILLEAGASTLAKTDKGETPLDCLRNWYERVQDDIDVYTRSQFEAVEKLLRKDLEKVGEETSAPMTTKERSESNVSTRSINGERRKYKENKAYNGSCRRSTEQLNSQASAKRFKPVESSSEDECIDPGSNSSSSDEALVLRMPPKAVSRNRGHSSKATNANSSEYAKTIASLKNRQSLLSLTTEKERSASPPRVRGPHLNANEVDLDNWLEDDADVMRPSKRTKVSEQLGIRVNAFLGTSNRNCTSRTVDSHASEEPDSNSAEVVEVAADSTTENAREEVPSRPPNAASISDLSRRSLDDTNPFCQLIKVEVNGNVLLVPVDSSVNPTFEHLAEEVSRRYFEFKGVRLELSLHTRDGALLSKKDPVSILSLLDESSRKIVAKVVSMGLPSISESYRDACSMDKISADEWVIESLELSQRTRTLRLDESHLRPKNLVPLLKVLSPRSLSVSNLYLSGNEIGDEGVKLLSECLSSMKNLLSLDLSSNNITASGMSELSTVVNRTESINDHPLQALCELRLDHNPLTDESVPYLVEFLNRLTSLTLLSLRDCDFTTFDLDDGSPSPCWNSIEELDLSYNFLGAEGVATFLKCLQPTKVKVLILGRTLERRHRERRQTRKIVQEVAMFLNHDEFCQTSNLIELDLSQTEATDSDICEVLRILIGAPYLEKLTLESNPDLTSLTLRRLFQLGTWPRFKLNISGCPKVLDYMENDDSVVSWMDFQRIEETEKPCAINLTVGKHVSKGAVEKLIEMWNKAIGADAFVEHEIFGYLKLGVKADSNSVL